MKLIGGVPAAMEACMFGTGCRRPGCWFAHPHGAGPPDWEMFPDGFGPKPVAAPVAAATKCPDCRKRFASEASMASHWQAKHGVLRPRASPSTPCWAQRCWRCAWGCHARGARARSMCCARHLVPRLQRRPSAPPAPHVTAVLGGSRSASDHGTVPRRSGEGGGGAGPGVVVLRAKKGWGLTIARL